MTATRTAVSLGRFIRTQKNLKVRQALAKAMIVSDDEETRKLLQETSDIIAEELNVKEIVLSANEEELVSFSAKANFKVMGKKLGAQMKEAAGIICKFTSSEIAAIVRGEAKKISLASGLEYDVTEDDLAIVRTEKEGFAAATENGITIALDTNLTAELIEEGIAREFISKIQNMRKETGLEVSDRIDVEFASDAEVVKAVAAYVNHISEETLAVNVKSVEALEGAKSDINGHDAVIVIKKA